MKKTAQLGGQQLSEQREFDEVVSKLADVNYEMFVRALVHLEGGKLTMWKFERWLKDDAGLLNRDLYLE
jgi:hypothetical protein